MTAKRSKPRITVYMPKSADAFVKRRVDDAEYPYEGPSDYGLAAIFYDMVIGLPHNILSPLMAKPERLREKLIEEIRKCAEADPQSVLPSELRQQIQAAIEKVIQEKCARCEYKNNCGR